uniref:DUF1517 domain-containing protein n=1 Tax=Paulinella chromatophora TaxID=39717 RepID=B1X3R8_PAUCH|nr:hypothetical protein PCC_0135 [Paulinella chromatophora]ACB42587.1 hypothetical protein PCC_0135 [Paulinella chromatophora]
MLSFKQLFKKLVIEHTNSRQTFWTVILFSTLFSALLLNFPPPAAAASGSRIGGRTQGLRSSSTYSAPSGYSGSGYSGYRGGGMGFPFLIPIYGFGGGGMFSFFIFIAIIGVLINSLQSVGVVSPLEESNGENLEQRREGPVTVLQLRIGLLASARDLQTDLRYLASTANTGTSKGLQRVLQDTVLALLRHPNLWVYANAECGQVPFIAAEATFNRLSMTERSKLRSEVISNVDGYQQQSSKVIPGLPDATSEFIAVTILVACRSKLTFKGANSAEDLQESLRVVASVPSDSLIALEIIWQPDGAGDVLTTEELLTTYPDLQHL